METQEWAAPLQQGAATNALDRRPPGRHAGRVRPDRRPATASKDRLQALDDRLRAVEVAFGKVDQRLTLERTVLPAPADD